MGSPRCLFRVSHTFVNQRRGVVLLPGVIPQGDERFRIGDRVELHRSDGSVQVTTIAGLELMHPRPPDGSVAILLNESVQREDVPIGTEVWSV